MKAFKNFMKKFAWIIVAAGMAVFFVIALIVYVKAEPDSVTELLNQDDIRLGQTSLSTMSGDLEVYPYVTKVYEYGTDKSDLNICYDCEGRSGKMIYGVVEDPSAEYNYFVECFVFSTIADKSLVKRTWGMTVLEGSTLSLTETEVPYIAKRWYDSYGDIKKKGGDNLVWYDTFMRITVKPGYDRIVFSNNEKKNNHVF